jgi:alpha-tubulin suppressor-like RCC1 family protein
LGDDEELADKAVPVAVAGGETFTALSLGYYHTAALTARGAAYSWGDGDYGVHGNGDNEDHAVPVRAMGGASYTSIAGSNPESYTQCYASRSGVLQCSGYNNDGMLPGDVTTYTPVTLAVRGAISYTAGDYHICALTTRGRATSGKIYCWGNNFHGELGNGQAPTDSSVPVEVQ